MMLQRTLGSGAAEGLGMAANLFVGRGHRHRNVTGGKLIRPAKLTVAEVIEKKNFIRKGSKQLWEHSRKIIAWGVKSGLYVE